MHIAIWGNELIAWTAAAAFAEYGNHVHINANIDEKLSFDQQSNLNTVLYNEPGLLDRINQQNRHKKITFANPGKAQQCKIQIIALAPDQLKIANNIVRKICNINEQCLLFINYSTFGLGASDQLNEQLQCPIRQTIAYIPDSLAEGNAYALFTKLKTLVIGCENQHSTQLIQAIYKPFCRDLDQLLIVSRREAEFMKFAVNGMLALRLGYINELANLADQLNINIDTILTGMGSDTRIGKHYLSPGCGFGGSHFSKTIQSMANLLESNRNSIILNTVLEENEKQKTRPFRKLWQHYRTNVIDKHIAVWGLSFKPDTASIYNAPSLSMIETLIAQGCYVTAHDPQAINNFKEQIPESNSIHYCNDPLKALEDADALIILTEWSEYWSPDYDQMLSLMRRPVIIDGRNILDKTLMESMGFTYYGIGR